MRDGCSRREDASWLWGSRDPRLLPTGSGTPCACLVNPILGLIKHPRSAPADANEQRYPVLDPRDTYDELRTVFARQLPGSRLRRRIGFRYTAVWTKPV